MNQSDDETLDLIISYILMGGVVASLILESCGLLLYCRNGHGFSISLDPMWRMDGRDFFAYVAALVASMTHGAPSPASLMAMGLIILMMTPYVRVVFSALFFALKRDWKYFCITFFVLAVLTASLIRH